MRLLGDWARASAAEADKIFEFAESATWVAAAETYEGGPVVLMAVTRTADGTWKGLVEYRYEFGSWGQKPFASMSGAQHWCEQIVDALPDGRS
jgi:hypothetical protein